MLCVACGGRSVDFENDSEGRGGRGGSPQTGGNAGATAGTSAGATGAIGGSSSTPDAGGASNNGATAGVGGAAAGSAGAPSDCDRKVLAKALHFPQAIAVEGESIYWTVSGNCSVDLEAGQGLVMKANLDGSSPVALAEDLPCPFAIAVHDGDVFWTTQPNAWDGVVMMAPRTGDGARTLADADSPLTVAADSDYVFYADREGIYRLERATNAEPMLLAPVDLTSTLTVSALALDDEHVYWIDPGQFDAGHIFRMEKSGGEPVALADTRRPQELALSSLGLFWLEERSFQDLQIQLLRFGETVPTSVAAAPGAHTLVAAENSVYWATGDGYSTGALYGIEPGAPEPFFVLEGEKGPDALALDSDYLYWANEGAGAGYDGELVRACR